MIGVFAVFNSIFVGLMVAFEGIGGLGVEGCLASVYCPLMVD